MGALGIQTPGAPFFVATETMGRLVKIRTVTAFVLVLLAAGAGTASAHGRLDRGFGNAGFARVAAPTAEYLLDGFAVAPGGQTYVLDGSSLIGFDDGGNLDGGFGQDGRVSVTPAIGDGMPEGLAVDSQGRLLVTGSTQMPGRKARIAYVIRLLPDGSRDTTFGSDGEVDTDFGLPASGQDGLSVNAFSILVGTRDRPIIGGSFGTEGEGESCGYRIGVGPDPFVARLTDAGALDPSFAGSGNLVLPGPGGLGSIQQTPDGGLAAFSYPCPTPPRFESRSPLVRLFTEAGEPSPDGPGPPLDFSYLSPVVDPKGRFVELESPPPAAEGPSALTRFLPTGRSDPHFGRDGRTFVRDLSGATAFAVDAESRPIIAVDGGLRRYRQDGKPDMRFGRRGVVAAKIGGPRVIAFDARGRIYTLSGTRGIVEVARFLPGR